MEIKEFYMESEFIMNGDSYCRKCIFSIPGIDPYKIKTTVTYVNSEDTSLIDGYAERYFGGQWHHLTDVIPKESSLDNLKFVQKELIKSAVSILDLKGDLVDFNKLDFSKYEMFKWDDLEDPEDSTDEKENVLTIDFNSGRT